MAGSKMFRLKTRYVDEDCYLETNRYTSNGNLVLRALDRIGQPVMTITVNIDVKLPDSIVMIKDYSENEGVVQCFIDLGFIEPTPVNSYESGFVVVRSYKLKDEIFKHIKDW